VSRTSRELIAQLARKTGNRRAFLKASGLVGVGALGASVMQSAFKIFPGDDSSDKLTRVKTAMGTYVSITAVHPSRDLAEEAIWAAFEEIDRVAGILSRHDSRSPVAHLNQSGSLLDTPPELVDVVLGAFKYNRLSHGAFDVTVGPLIELLEANSAHGKTPGDRDVEHTLELVGMDRVELGNGGLIRVGSGMTITLDGIAKGYIVDRASDVLAAHGVTDHLINAGGDIRTRGCSTGKRPWKIAIEDPEKKRHYPDLIRMNDGAVATSGSYEVFYNDDKTLHHIVDPGTARSPHLARSVTTRAATVMEADALSTAVFVMGPEDGLRMIESIRDTECLAISAGDQQHRSSGWVSS